MNLFRNPLVNLSYQHSDIVLMMILLQKSQVNGRTPVLIVVTKRTLNKLLLRKFIFSLLLFIICVILLININICSAVNDGEY